MLMNVCIPLRISIERNTSLSIRAVTPQTKHSTRLLRSLEKANKRSA